MHNSYEPMESAVAVFLDLFSLGADGTSMLIWENVQRGFFGEQKWQEDGPVDYR